MIPYLKTVIYSFLLLLISCQETIVEPKKNIDNQEITKEIRAQVPSKTLHYLALGDSYTIGQGVELDESWSIQLANRLQDSGFQIEPVKIIARTGWTTGNLKQAIIAENPDSNYDLVSLLIGVNNQYQDRSEDEYRAEFTELLNTAIQLAENDKTRVFVLSIPDYGVTPFGSGFANISQEIDRFNAINRQITANKGVSYFNITPISREAKDDLSLLALDKLHPSQKMYSLWVDLIYEDVAYKLLE